jgi:hypothetical protein
MWSPFEQLVAYVAAAALGAVALAAVVKYGEAQREAGRKESNAS